MKQCAACLHVATDEYGPPATEFALHCREAVSDSRGVALPNANQRQLSIGLAALYPQGQFWQIDVRFPSGIPW